MNNLNTTKSTKSDDLKKKDNNYTLIVSDFYYLDHYGIAVVFIRTIITVPAHAFMSVPMGYFVAKSRLELDKRNGKGFVSIFPLILLSATLGNVFCLFLVDTQQFFPDQFLKGSSPVHQSLVF